MVCDPLPTKPGYSVSPALRSHDTRSVHNDIHDTRVLASDFLGFKDRRQCFLSQ